MTFMECCMLDGKSRVVSFGGQYQVNHTEMLQAGNGSADMYGSVHRIEEAVM